VKKTYWFILGVLILVIIVVALLWQWRKFPRLKEEVLPSITPEVIPEKTRSVKLYFVSEKGTTLTIETREINATGSELDQAHLIIQELIVGPAPNSNLAPTIPPGTKLRQIYFDSGGSAYVDFSREIQDNHPGGSTGELLTIFSVVNTLVANSPKIKRVQVLVEGKEIPTLAGHIDTSRPFKKNEEILLDTAAGRKEIVP